MRAVFLENTITTLFIMIIPEPFWGRSESFAELFCNVMLMKFKDVKVQSYLLLPFRAKNGSCCKSNYYNVKFLLCKDFRTTQIVEKFNLIQTNTVTRYLFFFFNKNNLTSLLTLHYDVPHILIHISTTVILEKTVSIS